MAKFKSTDNKIHRLASTSGHVAFIGPDYREIPKELEKQALAKGCVSPKMKEHLKTEDEGAKTNTKAKKK